MPEDPDFTLYLSGGWHLTKARKRITDLPVEPDSVDVVFEENVTYNPPSQTVILTNWAVTPFICLFLTLYLTALNVASKLELTDSGVVDMLEKGGAEVVMTDRNFHRMLATERRLWGIGHWAFVVMSLFGVGVWIQSITPAVSIFTIPFIELLPASLQDESVIVVLGFELLAWFLFAGAIMGLFFITGTTETRNYAILDRIEDHVESVPNSSTGCLVVGGAHVPHLKKLIEESDLVKLGDEQ